MPQLKITVVKTFSPEDVFGHEFRTERGEAVPKCHLEEDQSWTTDGLSMPEGFCSWAWEDLRKDRLMLYYGGSIPETQGVVYVSCSDGTRPVVFKMERL